MFKRILENLKKMKLITILYAVAIIIFVLMISIVSNDQSKVHSTRQGLDYKVVEDYEFNLLKEEGTPQGVVKEYRFTLKDIVGDSVLTFYNVHNYVHIFIADELVYSMEPVKQKMGDTLGLSWVVVPLEAKDVNQEVSIYLTPVYSNVVDQEVEFDLGSESKVIEDIVLSDLPIFILSIFSIIIGVLLVVITVISKLNMKIMESYPFYLGVFSILIGLWKGLDLFVTTIVLKGDPKTIFFISFYSLCLIPTAFMLYFKELVRKYNNKVVNVVSYLVVGVNILLLLSQLFGILDLRENLYLIHLLLFVIIILIAYVNIYLFVTKQKAKTLYMLTLAFSLTSVVDISFYLHNSATRLMIFSFLLFLAYALSIGIDSLTEKGRKAFIDVKTELYNSTYCQEMVESNVSIKAKTKAVIMMDLNYLKKTNDLYGHEEGDVIIKDFADCIRGENKHNVVVGRVGGDEFIMLIRDTSESELELIKKRVKERADIKNAKTRVMRLSYGFGYAYSADPKVKYEELIKQADKEMYKDKKLVKEQEALEFND